MSIPFNFAFHCNQQTVKKHTKNTYVSRRYPSHHTHNKPQQAARALSEKGAAVTAAAGVRSHAQAAVSTHRRVMERSRLGGLAVLGRFLSRLDVLRLGRVDHAAVRERVRVVLEWTGAAGGRESGADDGGERHEAHERHHFASSLRVLLLFLRKCGNAEMRNWRRDH